MLKPWVVQALFWFLRAGLLVVLAGTIVITWRIGYAKRKTGVGTVAAVLLLLAFYVVVGYAGSCLGHDQVALFGGLLSLVTSGWILSFRVKSAWMMLVHIPTVLGLALSCLLIVSSVFPSGDPNLPEWEQRVSQNLLCRAYPKDDDSMPVTRLMLLRETEDRFKDEIVNDSLANFSPVTCLCTQAKSGAVVVMEMRGRDGKVSRKEVMVAEPQGN